MKIELYTEVNFRGPTAKNGKCIALVECETKKGPAVKAQIETEQNTTYHRMSMIASFYARKPRNPKLIALKNRLNELGYHPTIAHEYVTEDRVWHSYFSITTDGVIG